MSGLFGSSALEVAIGLFFVYFLLSLICSSINETVALLVKLRAKHLEYGIDNLLCDPDLANRVLSHPLIKSMGNTRAEIRPVQKFAEWFLGREKAGLPSYIPSRTFALALFDALVPTKDKPITVACLRREALDMANDIKNAGRQSIGTILLQLIDASKDPQKVLLQVEGVKRRAESLFSPDKDELMVEIKAAKTLEDIRSIVLNLPDDGVRQAVLKFIEAGQIELAAVRKSVEIWFDDAMERVTGVYKRYVQTLLLFFAFAVTLLLGVDTFQIIDSLATNPTLRAATVAEANRVVNTSEESGQPLPDDRPVLDRLNELGLPIGYGDAPALGSEEWWTWLVHKIPGLFLTTFAVSLGAPFWFEVLNKVANIRASGTRPKKSEVDSTVEEKEKD